MTWQCKLLDFVKTNYIKIPEPRPTALCGYTVLVDSAGNQYDFKTMPVGTMFYIPANVMQESDPEFNEWPWYLCNDSSLSDYYQQHNSNRRPLMVKLPGPELFLIDGKCWKDGVKYGGWVVSGMAPQITVSPSINFKGIYHGYLSNGIVGDDVEGRKFDQYGNLIR